jgi:hypothetical protein
LSQKTLPKNSRSDNQKDKRKRVNCSFSSKEFRKLKSEAKKAGLSPTAFLKKSAFAYMQKEFLVPQEQGEKLNQAIYLLRQIGNNTNQIAAKANTLHKISILDLAKAKDVLNELEKKIIGYVCYPQERDNQVPIKKDGELWSGYQIPQSAEKERQTCSIT